MPVRSVSRFASKGLAESGPFRRILNVRFALCAALGGVLLSAGYMSGSDPETGSSAGPTQGEVAALHEVPVQFPAARAPFAGERQPVHGDEAATGEGDDGERRAFTVRKGSTLAAVLASADVPRRQAHDAVGALKKVFDPRSLQIGQRIDLTLSKENDLESMNLDLGLRRVGVRRGSDGRYEAFRKEKLATTRLAAAQGRIRSSLYETAVRGGVPARTVAELIRLYSWEVDFQREIHPGDGFHLAYEQLLGADGELLRYGDIVFAQLTLSNDEKPLYRFETPSGVDYFDAGGESARRALLRTPVDGARLTSRFGKRKHPILGFTKLHRGVDFAAPEGTPIMAAGDGVVVFRGNKGGFGRYILVRHNARYSTAYGHLSAFKRGVTKSSRIRQGQVIGFVGSSGLSTGPHLHYEIHRNGRQVNPLSVKMPAGKKLTGDALARFERERERIDGLVAGLRATAVLH